MEKRIQIATLVAVVMTFILVGALVLLWDGDEKDVIRISGNIELTEVRIAFKTAGKLVDMTVAEGDDVRKDTIVARLDKEQLEQQRKRDMASLASAKAQLEQLYTAIDYQRETVESRIDQWRAELDGAGAQLDKLLTGSRAQEIAQARAAVQEARSRFEQAERDWERAQLLYRKEDISTAQYDQSRTQCERAAAALKQVKERTALVVEGPRKEDIRTARANVARAEAGLRSARADRLEIKRREQEIVVRKADIERARAQVALMDTYLDDIVAESAIDGVVLIKAAEVGEILAPGATVLTIGDLDHPWLRGYINERDLGRVKYGQRVEVTTDSFPGKAYKGHISFISSEAEFTPKQIQTPEERVKLVYRIKIDIDNPDRELKLNMPVDARIDIDTTQKSHQSMTVGYIGFKND
jgi:HlyD family secretion protein